MTNRGLTQVNSGDDVRARKVVAERHAAFRRWIDDEDEAACRGID